MLLSKNRLLRRIMFSASLTQANLILTHAEFQLTNSVSQFAILNHHQQLTLPNPLAFRHRHLDDEALGATANQRFGE